ncbi:glycosyltransferase family 2 protein [Butyrivibrio sp. XPD2006]|uniref:glycosyltransferase family 2 protein n=1 Tax=Butyrivibrio sp. XPD2006 TaxID=1280668 RepID=UPI0003B51ACB|nr:glycosyltransferase family 2 protein [Butyrivibrio sp. XPD2006]
MSDLISIIVPIYKVEDYLRKCVDSLIRQTYTNIEILLVDDGSPDNCPAICNECAKADDRIKVIHKPNGGLSDARNAGIEVAKGEYFLFVDSDDYININMVNTLYEAVKKNSADVAICRYQSVKDDEDINIESIEDYSDSFVLTDDEYFENPVYSSDRRTEFIVAWNKLYARKLFDNVRYPKGKVHEDEFTTYKLLYASAKTVYVPHVLYYYVQRGDSIMSAGIAKKRLLVLDAISERLSFYESRNEMRYWLKDFESFRKSYLRYLGAVKDSPNLKIEDFDKYKKIYRQNVKKYLKSADCSVAERFKVQLSGLFPYHYAQFLRNTH